MKTTVRRITAAAIIVASLCISATAARAASITTADYGIGTVVDGTPADEGSELQYVQLLIDIWNGAKPGGIYQFGNSQNTFAALTGTQVPPSLTAPTTGNPDSEDFIGNGNSATIDLGTSGAEFLLTKWGGGDILYYVGNLSGPVTVENDQINPGNGFTGLSHFELLGGSGQSVPDGGSTLVLLGSALCGLTWLRGRISRS